MTSHSFSFLKESVLWKKGQAKLVNSDEIKSDHLLKSWTVFKKAVQSGRRDISAVIQWSYFSVLQVLVSSFEIWIWGGYL